MQYFLVAVLAGFAAQFNFGIDNPANWVAGAVCVFLGFLAVLCGIASIASKR